MVISDDARSLFDRAMPMAAETTTFFVIADRVNIRALTKLTDKVLYSLNYDMGRLG